MVVVLPAPLGPRKPYISPFSTLRSMPLRIWYFLIRKLERKDFFKFVISSVFMFSWPFSLIWKINCREMDAKNVKERKAV